MCVRRIAFTPKKPLTMRKKYIKKSVLATQIAVLMFASHQVFAVDSTVNSTNQLASQVKNQAPIKKIQWHKYNAETFKLAQKENRFIVLNLKANWCHFCHVMEATTYKNPAVIALLNSKFIAVEADHDERSDLAERYRDWGWPATIVFNAQGEEIVKRAGYIEPNKMIAMLQAIVDDPRPEGGQVSYPKKINVLPGLVKLVKTKLEQRHIDAFDTRLGGLRLAQKFLEHDELKWDLDLAKKGDKAAKQRAILTLNNGLALIDDQFGGAYQYSTHSDWQHPHYEKIMKTQAVNLRLYAQAYQQFGDANYKKAAQAIQDYLSTFLHSKDGGFYTSQDADLIQGTKAHDYFALNREARLKLGIPKVDTHQYASDNGLAISALLSWYKVNQDPKTLKLAQDALAWVYKNRRFGRGGYRHNTHDLTGAYLADTLYMGQAWLRLAEVSPNKSEQMAALRQAKLAADFIASYFKHNQAGLVSSVDNGTPLAPLPQIDQNISAAHFLLNLYVKTGDKSTLALAEYTMRYLNSPEVALSRLTEAGLLSLDVLYNNVLKNN